MARLFELTALSGIREHVIFNFCFFSPYRKPGVCKHTEPRKKGFWEYYDKVIEHF